MLALEQRLSFTARRARDTTVATCTALSEPLRQLETVLRLGKLRSRRSVVSQCEVPRTREARLVQLARCVAELVWSFRAPGRRVLLYGEGLRFLTGRVDISSRRITVSALRSLAKKCPFFIAYSQSRHPLAELCAALSVDRTQEITMILSGNSASVFFARLGGAPVTIHMQESATKLEISKRHAGLQRAHRAIQSQEVRALLPVPIKQVNSHGIEIFIRSRLRGEAFSPAATQAQLEEQVRAAMRPLLALHAAPTSCASVPDKELFARLPSLIDRFPRYALELRTAIDALNGWSRSHLAPVLVHGDYWLGNVLLLEGGRRLSGIVDWDCVREDGCAGYDALHLILLAASTYPARSLNACLKEVWTKQWTNDFLPRMLGELTQSFKLGAGDVEYLAGLIWLTRLYQREGSRDQNWQYHQIYLPAVTFNSSATYQYGAYSLAGREVSEAASLRAHFDASLSKPLS